MTESKFLKESEKALEKLVLGAKKEIVNSIKSQIDYIAGPRERDLLLVDISYSMDEKDYYPSRLEAAKNACFTFAELKYNKGLNDEIALMSFAECAWINADFKPISHSMEDFEEALHSLKTTNSTHIGRALGCAGNLMFNEKFLARNYTKKHIILLTDGYDNDEFGRKFILDNASRIKDKNCLISCIGIGGSPSNVDEALLREIASVIDGKIQYWFIKDADSLNKKYQELATGLVVYDKNKAIRL
jgi:Mg-chelatase subunit ChlD